MSSGPFVCRPSSGLWSVAVCFSVRLGTHDVGVLGCFWSSLQLSSGFRVVAVLHEFLTSWRPATPQKPPPPPPAQQQQHEPKQTKLPSASSCFDRISGVGTLFSEPKWLSVKTVGGDQTLSCPNL